MAKPEMLITKRPLLSWVFRGNLKLQILLLLIIVVTVFARVLPLEMQKRIVNEAITLRKIDLLLLYCGIYLASVTFASGLKYMINVLQTLIGQRTVAAMRKELYHHLITLPLSFFRKTQPGMVVTSLVNELATAGDFIGMAAAIPITNILTLLAFAVYLFWLNTPMAILSMSIYPIVLMVLPMLQRRVNAANKKRVDAARDISGKIAESITGIHEIQGNGAFPIENSKFDRLVDRLFKIRVTWNLYRFGVKVLNNFINNMSPFLIFIVGGYLAINGQVELGAIVAFLSAQEKLADPWRELIEFFQAYQDATVSYKRTMEYFDAEPEHLLAPVDREPYDLDGQIDVKDLSFVTEEGIHLLDGVSLSLSPGQHLALVGFSGSGKSTLALCIGQLYKYTGGHLLMGGQEVSELTKRDLVYNMGFVSQSPFIFDGTIEENLLYACRAKDDGDESLPSLDDMIEILQQTGIFVDVLRFGLNSVLSREGNEELVSQIIQVRENFQRDFGKALADNVEFFAQDKYLSHSSVAENLVFGTPNRESFALSNLSRNEYFLEFMNRADLTRPMLGIGADLTRQTVDILGSLPPDELFFEQSPIAANEFSTYKVLSERLKKVKLHQLTENERHLLLSLALRFTPGRHKMVHLPEMIKNLILEGRALLREKISADDPGAVSFYEISDYIHAETILNNIFFGKIRNATSQVQEKIDQSIIHLLIAEDLLETIIKIGMQFQVGSKGDRLSGGQRQKLAIARAFLKNPRILILDEATSALDNRSQARIQNLLETRWKGKSTLIAVVHRLDIIKNYDRIAVMKAGKLVETGSYEELMNRKGILYELIAGKR